MPNPVESKNLEQALRKANITLPEQKFKALRIGDTYYKGTVSILNPAVTNFKPDFKADMIVMISDGEGCTLPQKVFKSIFDNMKEGSKEIRISYSSKIDGTKYDPFFEVYKGYGKDSTLGQKLLSKKDTAISVSKDDLSKLVWDFDPMVIGFFNSNKHPQVVVNFSYTSKENTKATKSVVIAHNSTPTIDASTVVYNVNDIDVEDTNGDFVSAYEVKLVNEKNVGKVDLVIKNFVTNTKEVHTIGKEGIRLSIKDLRDNFLTFNKSDGYIPQKGLAAGDVKISVSACDEFGWGPRQVLHAPLSK